MTELELKALLAAEISSALGHEDGDLASQRAKAMDYYLGEMTEHLAAPEGRSKAVSTDVQDVVESIMPSMLEIFTGTEEVVKFAPVGPEDEEAAEQETDYINHVFYQQCDGFLVLHDFIKDALLQKNGVVKHWWETSDKFEREQYRGLDPVALQLLLDDPDVELIEQTESAAVPALPNPADPNSAADQAPQQAPPPQQSNTPEMGGMDPGQAGPVDPAAMQPMPAPPPPPEMVDVAIKRASKQGKPRIEVVPPGEFLIAKDAKSIREARFVGHKTKKTQSDLIAMGFARDKVEELPSYAAVESIEEQARRTTGDDNQSHAQDEQNRAMRLIEIVECYPRLDWDDDGLAEIRKVTCSADGAVILANEACDRAPFSAMCAIRMAHKWLGRSVADLVVEIQTIKTALLRQFLDDCYQQVSPRVIVPEAAANEYTYEDLLTHRPGGIIRVANADGFGPFQTGTVAAVLLPAIEYLDSVKEARTGVTRYNQGLDAQSLNKTATGINQIMGQAQMRMRMIARVFAETGVRELFLALHELIQKHDRQQRVARLRNRWVTVDPAQWRTRTDMTISVALGSGGRLEQLGFLQQLLGIQVQAITMQGGPQGPLVTMGNVYATLKRLVEAGGLKSVEPYFTDPTGQPMPEPPPDPKAQEAQARTQLAQQQAQIAQQKAQTDSQLSAQKMQLEQQRAESDAQLGMQKAQLEQQIAAAKLALERETAMARIELERAKARAEIELAREKCDADIELRRETERNRADIARQSAASKARHEGATA